MSEKYGGGHACPAFGHFRHSWDISMLEDKDTRLFRNAGVWLPTDVTSHPRITKSLTAVAAFSLLCTFNSWISFRHSFGTCDQCVVSGIEVRLGTEMKIFRRLGESCSCHLQGECGLSGRPYTYLAAGDVISRANHTSCCRIYVRVPPQVPQNPLILKIVTAALLETSENLHCATLPNNKTLLFPVFFCCNVCAVAFLPSGPY